MNNFNEFIEIVKLQDIPLVGRRYTWNRRNDTSKTRSGHILVTCLVGLLVGVKTIYPK